MKWNSKKTWSMAHGIKHGRLFAGPKICGKEELKLGLAWIAENDILP